jgi:pimeloyl-ACP methyl ester carboxylesterase
MTPSPISRFYTSQDGLRLHLRDHGGPPGRTPVVCLPGLARTAADFDRLAARLSAGRRTVALDYRGRGLSDRDPNWKNYDLMVESADILSVLAGADIAEAIVVGTSRGGLHAMLLAAVRPALLRGVVLNDIGPVLEPKGLARIRGYVGKLPAPRSWSDAVSLAKSIMGAQFTGLDEASWETYARLTFDEKDGRFLPRYDLNLMRPLAELDLEVPLPALWPQYEALAHVPLMAIRGENSDLLSAETFAEMGRRHPRFDAVTVAGQGHAPLLLDDATLDRIAGFVEGID